MAPQKKVLSTKPDNPHSGKRELSSTRLSLSPDPTINLKRPLVLCCLYSVNSLEVRVLTNFDFLPAWEWFLDFYINFCTRDISYGFTEKEETCSGFLSLFLVVGILVGECDSEQTSSGLW